MTNETVQVNEYGEVTDDVQTDSVQVEVPLSEPVMVPASTESSGEVWRSFQVKVGVFFENTVTQTIAFFNSNRRLLTTLGWIALAFLGVRLLFGALDALDDIPLVSPTLKLIGFVYVVSFVWRYLIRKSDRQELSRQLNHVKSEVFGSQS